MKKSLAYARGFDQSRDCFDQSRDGDGAVASKYHGARSLLAADVPQATQLIEGLLV